MNQGDQLVDVHLVSNAASQRDLGASRRAEGLAAFFFGRVQLEWRYVDMQVA